MAPKKRGYEATFGLVPLWQPRPPRFVVHPRESVAHVIPKLAAAAARSICDTHSHCSVTATGAQTTATAWFHPHATSAVLYGTPGCCRVVPAGPPGGPRTARTDPRVRSRGARRIRQARLCCPRSTRFKRSRTPRSCARVALSCNCRTHLSDLIF